jgi:hypothetical protein
MNMMKKHWLIEKLNFIIFEIIISDESHSIYLYKKLVYVHKCGQSKGILWGRFQRW